jgi:hypothetical protein
MYTLTSPLEIVSATVPMAHRAIEGSPQSLDSSDRRMLSVRAGQQVSRGGLQG